MATFGHEGGHAFNEDQRGGHTDPPKNPPEKDPPPRIALPEGDWPYDEFHIIQICLNHAGLVGAALAFALNVLAGKLPASGLGHYLDLMGLPPLEEAAKMSTRTPPAVREADHEVA